MKNAVFKPFSEIIISLTKTFLKNIYKMTMKKLKTSIDF